MITGDVLKEIKKYLPIDYCADGYDYVVPEKGEVLIGVPYQWLTDNSIPFIEHIVKGVVVKTVNALSVAEIIFE